MPLIASKQIGVDAFVPGNVRVLQQFDRATLQVVCIEPLVLKTIVERTPLDALHFLSVGGEGLLHPPNHVLEVGPQLVGVLVVLVSGHVTLDLAAGFPFQRRLQQFLTDWRASDVLAG